MLSYPQKIRKEGNFRRHAQGVISKSKQIVAAPGLKRSGVLLRFLEIALHGCAEGFFVFVLMKLTLASYHSVFPGRTVAENGVFVWRDAQCLKLNCQR